MGFKYEGLSGSSAIHPTELDFINSHIEPNTTFIEIGTLHGVTIAEFARRNPSTKFLSVDPFKPGIATGPGDVTQWWANHRKNNFLFCGTFQELIEVIVPDKVFWDIIFIDGDHSYEACKKDLKVAGVFVKETGIIFVHDYKHGEKFEGIDKAVEEFCGSEGWKIVGVFRHTVVLRKND